MSKVVTLDSNVIISYLIGDSNASKAEKAFLLAEQGAFELYISKHAFLEVVVFFGSKRLSAYDEQGTKIDRSAIATADIRNVLYPFFQKEIFVHPEKENLLEMLHRFGQQTKLSSIYDYMIIN